MPAPPVLHPLQLYRRLLRLASRLPAGDSAPALARLRSAFRAGAGESSPAAIRALLADANARLGYLRIVTPRMAGEDEAGVRGARSADAARRFVVSAAGELVPLDGAARGGGLAAAPHAGGRTIDEADVRRHRASLERFHFGGRRAG